jgi:acyl-CoA-binding protein
MAWKKRQGMTREAAMQAYVDQIDLIDEELSTGAWEGCRISN